VCGAFASRDVRVVAADMDEEGLGRIADDLRGKGSDLVTTTLDVTRRDDVEELVGREAERAGGLDIVVNLAGVLRNQVVVKIDDDAFGTVMNTHLIGTLNTMRAALPGMRELGYGRIVNMSSLAVRGTVAGGAYAAAKGAIEGLTRAAAIESAKYGVTVNCVAPGLVDAGMFRTVPAEYQKESEAQIPAGRAGTSSEVAECVAFLAGEGASYVTGQTLTICGGLSLGL
jgi:3-oxoacyl-[acyl-carrier protein] reductase